MTAQHSGAHAACLQAGAVAYVLLEGSGRACAFCLRRVVHHPCRAPIFDAGILSVPCGSTTNAQGL